MNTVAQFLLGVLGTFALAFIFVLGSASALQTWSTLHQARQFRPPVAAADQPGRPSDPGVPSFWYGRS
jgi:hypothetical protein